MSVQTLDTVTNPLTGKVNGKVYGNVDQLIIAVPPDQDYEVEINDEYGFIHKAYYKLVVEGIEGQDILLTPIKHDGSVGHQDEPYEGTSRTTWTEQDNIDNSKGKAFRSYVLTVGPRKPGSDFHFQLKRWTKRFSNPMNPPAGTIGNGRRDYPRPLNIRLVCQPEKSFEEYVALRNVMP